MWQALFENKLSFMINKYLNRVYIFNKYIVMIEIGTVKNIEMLDIVARFLVCLRGKNFDLVQFGSILLTIICQMCFVVEKI